MKPEYALANGKKYKINTDFRVALACDKIALDPSVGDYEGALAIIYKLFGEEALNDVDNHVKLLELGVKFLRCNEDTGESIDISEEPNMDVEQDMDYIEASFVSDYGIDINKDEIHWWTFYKLLKGLTENCVLSRVRYIRDFDLSQIKDSKDRQKWQKAKDEVALNKIPRKIDDKRQASVDKFKKLAGLDK